MCRVRSRCLISSAVSKPSSPGIWTSSRITAKSSCAAGTRSASSPDVRADELVAERLEDRLEREQVLRRSSTRSSDGISAGALAQLRSSVDEQRRDLARAAGRALAARRARARRAASRRARPSPGPGRSRRRRARAIAREPARAVVVRAGQDDADAALAVGVGGATRRARRSTGARTGRAVGREREALRARRAGGSRAARCRRAAARSRPCRPPRAPAARSRRASRSRERGRCDSGARCWAIDDGGVELGGQARRGSTRTRVEPAPGGADRDQLEVASSHLPVELLLRASSSS